ncbi:MAG: hypothetical protein ACOX42_02375 [Clostridia bacterium]
MRKVKEGPGDRYGPTGPCLDARVGGENAVHRGNNHEGQRQSWC